MRKANFVVMIALSALISLPATCNAEGWTWPNLNPFAKKEPKSTLPNWPPATKPLQIPKPIPQKTVWQKMNEGWHKVTDPINPWAEKTPAAAKPFVPSGVNPSGKGPFSTNSQQAPPQSVSGFLAQPRPGAN